jgi:hypothetical protein
MSVTAKPSQKFYKSELLRWMFLCWVGSIGSVLLLLKP